MIVPSIVPREGLGQLTRNARAFVTADGLIWASLPSARNPLYSPRFVCIFEEEANEGPIGM
jgi:hypothetical protein